MVETTLVAILDGVPDGKHVGMQESKRLSAISRIPEIGIAATVGTGRAADGMMLVLGNKQSSMSPFNNTLEELFLWYVTLGFQQMVLP